MENIFLTVIVGYIIGSLREKWVYFSKTSKHLQDLKKEEKTNA